MSDKRIGKSNEKALAAYAWATYAKNEIRKIYSEYCKKHNSGLSLDLDEINIGIDKFTLRYYTKLIKKQGQGIELIKRMFYQECLNLIESKTSNVEIGSKIKSSFELSAFLMDPEEVIRQSREYEKNLAEEISAYGSVDSINSVGHSSFGLTTSTTFSQSQREGTATKTTKDEKPKDKKPKDKKSKDKNHK